MIDPPLGEWERTAHLHRVTDGPDLNLSAPGSTSSTPAASSPTTARDRAALVLLAAIGELALYGELPSLPTGLVLDAT